MKRFLRFTTLCICFLAVNQLQAININHPFVFIDVPTAEEVVQKQFKAYNARNLDTFLSCFSDDVVVYLFPDQLLYNGKAELKKSYSNFFTNTPDLYCELVDRNVNGNKVKDEVMITRVKKTKPMKTTIMYVVEEGLITKMYFIN